jgi:hypothetical protein
MIGHVVNMYLTKSGQNADLWTFMTKMRILAGCQKSKNRKNNFF